MNDNGGNNNNGMRSNWLVYAVETNHRIRTCTTANSGEVVVIVRDHIVVAPFYHRSV